MSELRLLSIHSIIVGERHRKDLGDIETLARSIDEVGLIHPIVVRNDGLLIAGARRLAAFKLRGKAEIPAHIVSHLAGAFHALKAESDENTCRKDFLPTEAYALVERLRPFVEAAAKERQLIGKSADGEAGGRGRTKPSEDSSEGLREPPRAERETRTELARATHMSHDTLGKIAAVVQAAEEKPELFGDLPEKMDAGNVNSAFREMKKREVTAEIRNEPQPLPDGPFRVIAIDPPWRYEKRKDDGTHRAALTYPDMSVEEICALPVAERAHGDCVLWLWTTNAFVRDAYRCLDAWGFTEKTILTWVKDRMGTGDWLRGKTEHCILAVRGKPVVTLTNQTTALVAPMREHSRKPDEFYSLVEALCPGSKLEMFAREPRDGWATWGAESTLFGSEASGDGDE